MDHRKGWGRGAMRSNTSDRKPEVCERCRCPSHPHVTLPLSSTVLNQSPFRLSPSPANHPSAHPSPPLRTCHLPPAGPERVQVALATSDAAIQFYSLRSGGSRPGMLIVTDITQPFAPDSVPLVRGLVVWKWQCQGERSLMVVTDITEPFVPDSVPPVRAVGGWEGRD